MAETSKKGPRRKLDEAGRAILIDFFEEKQYPTKEEKHALLKAIYAANATGTYGQTYTVEDVSLWFNARRSRAKEKNAKPASLTRPEDNQGPKLSSSGSLKFQSPPNSKLSNTDLKRLYDMWLGDRTLSTQPQALAGLAIFLRTTEHDIAETLRWFDLTNGEHVPISPYALPSPAYSNRSPEPQIPIAACPPRANSVTMLPPKDRGEGRVRSSSNPSHTVVSPDPPVSPFFSKPDVEMVFMTLPTLTKEDLYMAIRAKVSSSESGEQLPPLCTSEQFNEKYIPHENAMQRVMQHIQAGRIPGSGSRQVTATSPAYSQARS